MKNILLLAHDDSGQEARLQAALDLTRALSGHLHCVDVTPLPLMADAAWASPGTILYDESDTEAANVERLKARLAKEDVAWSCEALSGEFASCLASRMRTADVVVLNRGRTGFPSPDMRGLIGELVRDTETLILAVPEDCRALNVSGNVLIAWDGSETAMVTVQRAVPLLRLAASVTVFQAGPLEKEAIPVLDAANYLARHDVSLEIETAPDDADLAGKIAAAAERSVVSYCVMGAFGHGRLREAVFGGTTQEMLGSSGVPLLLGR